MEKRYMISDAAKIVEVENHVLRYWEEELGLTIPRNEKGHRYYREQDMMVLQSIRDLKEQGFHLKAIKLALPQLNRIREMGSDELFRLREELNSRVSMEEHTQPLTGVASEKLVQFEQMLHQMIQSALEEVGQKSEERIAERVTERLQKEMDYLLRQREEVQDRQVELLKKILDQLQEEKGLDCIAQAAAAEEKKSKKEKRIHKKLFAKRG